MVVALLEGNKVPGQPPRAVNTPTHANIAQTIVISQVSYLAWNFLKNPPSQQARGTY